MPAYGPFAAASASLLSWIPLMCRTIVQFLRMS